MAEDHWRLLRIGYQEPPFNLQEHLPVITVGRADSSHKQLKGTQVSRLHLELRKYVDSATNRAMWKAYDPGSNQRTFINGHIIPYKQEIALNDKDLLSIGGNHTASAAEGQKRQFLYKVIAPSSWTTVSDDSDTDSLDIEAATPPKSPELRHVEVKKEPTDDQELPVAPRTESPAAASSLPDLLTAVKEEDLKRGKKSKSKDKDKQQSTKSSKSKAREDPEETEKISNKPKSSKSTASKKDDNKKAKSSKASDKNKPSASGKSGKEESSSKSSKTDKKRRRSSTSSDSSPVRSKKTKKKKAVALPLDSSDEEEEDISDRKRKRKEDKTQKRNKKRLTIKLKRLDVPNNTDVYGAKVKKIGSEFKIKSWLETRPRSPSPPPTPSSSSSEELFSSDNEETEAVTDKPPPSVEVVDEQEQTFSQAPEIIELNSDDDEDYYRSSQHSPGVKTEAKEIEEEENVTKDDDENDQDPDEAASSLSDADERSPPPGSPEVIDISDDDLMDSQKGLFHKVLTKIKKEEAETPVTQDIIEKNIELMEEDELEFGAGPSTQDVIEQNLDPLEPKFSEDEESLGKLSDDEISLGDPVEFFGNPKSPDASIEEGEILDRDFEDLEEVPSPGSPNDQHESKSRKLSFDQEKVQEQETAPKAATNKYTGESSASKEPPQRQPQLIDALPQPKRGAFNRGISQEKVLELTEKNKQPDSPKSIKKTVFYGSTTTTERTLVKVQKFGHKEVHVEKTNEELVKIRKEKLAQIAAKDKKSTASSTVTSGALEREEAGSKDQPRQPTKSAAKIKSSGPKLNRQFLQEFNLFGKITAESKKATARPRISARSKSVEATTPTPAASTSKPAAPPEARTAVVTVRPDGTRTVNKMTFDNVVKNSMPDENVALADPQPSTSTSGSASKSIEDVKRPRRSILRQVSRYQNDEQDPNSNSAKKNISDSRKRVQFPSDSSKLVAILEIPSIGMGKKLGTKAEIRADLRAYRKHQQELKQRALQQQIRPVQDAHPGLARHLEQQRHNLELVQLRQAGYSLNHAYERILGWNVNWLEEQKTNKQAPPVHGSHWQINLVPNVFAGYPEYCRTLYPLMLHELWASLFKDYESSGGQNQDILMVITHIHNNDPNSPTADTMSKITTLGLITENERKKDRYLPQEGWLTSVELRYASGKGNSSHLKPCFGYVESFRVFPRKGELASHPGLKELEKNAIPDRRAQLKHIVEMSIIIKKIQTGLDCRKPLFVRPVARIKHMMRLFGSIEDAATSPLFRTMLQMNETNAPAFDLADGSEPPCQYVQDFVPLLNSEQKRIMSSSAKMATTDMRQPRVALIQGPPGTGKSTTITAMVLQILFRWRSAHPGDPNRFPRILLTAPSNAAVDELVRRLLKIRESLPAADKFKLLRIGKESSVASDVRGVTLERLRDNATRANMRTTGGNETSLNMSIEQIQRTVNRYRNELAEYRHEEVQRNLTLRKLRAAEADLRKAKNRQGDPGKLDEHVKRQMSDELLAGADIIAVTLSSSMNGTMENFFVHGNIRSLNARHSRPFSICIMDEASQCIEPEGLIPLKLGFSKLIMVGDPEQLPATVSSLEAKDNRFNVSLFTRLFKHFEDYNPNIIQRLQLQYRMHPDIADWPNQYFYGGKLRSGDQNRQFNLFNYKLLNLKSSRQRMDGGNISNPMEAKFVAKLARAVRDNLDEGLGWSMRRSFSIGIITFYNRQRNVITNELRRLGLRVAHDKPDHNSDASEDGEVAEADNAIIVKTVDGFQGSESDIIIISCVRSLNYGEERGRKGQRGREARSIGFVADANRLNVALTRARYGLYVVGNFDVLSENKMWRTMVKDAKNRRLFQVVRNESNDVSWLLMPQGGPY